MFDMPKNAGDHAGYQLRITFNTKTSQYLLAGYVVREDKPNVLTIDMDGGMLLFNSLEAVINHLMDIGGADAETVSSIQ